ncbi:hypothetical protein HBI56_122340 [Parastagonospora nodorum]|uniref:Uncharacterized protein n=2 Tax=Phaeosphaeria nodorum (strain SN15 / ATCC MYA-4574 / FGSC 10173) TaxID=321614 RepID=A0A7U2FBC9_PHANO|nr:hypothetical protein SNOG_05149 [Parastagonospora nodorum SN15]KAH3917104.1 hypothetical protein HBH56_052350 [Parastagonospora nodorum]EAT87540.2 hypothetical protein SNOG_05149 [Parastagonospora nodorum SN15]KAH3935446.1 hypothetical protein HBH54_038150 [Parastagonospora nodorum]KAH3948606.1 hypothetical protein HBH53_101020 [Parastagonospora nodorum]KAH3970116.1 hypothetical protein HBH51_118150 [Parastagonospora nodorum]
MSTTNPTPTNRLATPSAQSEETTREAAIRATFSMNNDSDSDLSDPPDSDDLHSPTDSDNRDQPNNSSNSSSDSDSPPLPLPPIYAHHISTALSLTVCQAHALHASMQSEMLAEGLLGEMSFRASVKKVSARVLKPVFKRVKADLGFLAEKEKEVGAGRLKELLVARARILNQNEKHNRWMVENGRVGRRRLRVEMTGAGAAQDEGVESEVHDSDTANGEERPPVTTAVSWLDIQGTETPAHEDTHRYQDQDQVQIPALEEERVQDNAEIVTRTSIPISLLLSGTGRDSVDDRAQPSTSHPIQANPPVVAQQNTSHPLQPNPSVVARPKPPHNQPITPPSHPTAFLIRHTTTPYAAAILSTPDLTLTRFTSLVSAQLSFDATGRIRAVVPRSPQAAPVNVFVTLDSEETWRAMVEIWAVWRREVGEAVVE